MKEKTEQQKQRERQLLADIMAAIQQGKADAPRMAYGIEIPKDRANQFILRYKRINGEAAKMGGAR